jgi:MarR family transcriptional regulator, 2-MHQ and catechol-resistance regulon repressor
VAITRHQRIDQILDATRAVNRAIWGNSEAIFKKYKLHPAQARVLHCVMHCPIATVSAIANAMHTTSSAATQLIESLAQAGFIVRSADARDRRKVHLQLSAKGRTAFTQFHRDLQRRAAKLLAALSTAELKQLFSILNKVTTE